VKTELVVGDLMTIEPIVIGPDARIEEAERMLEANEVTGLPVVDGDARLVGVISQTDLLRGSGDLHSAVRRRYTGLRVADLMTSPPITVDVTTPVVLSSMDFVSLYAEG
jgi:CBS domain-containing protein